MTTDKFVKIYDILWRHPIRMTRDYRMSGHWIVSLNMKTCSHIFETECKLTNLISYVSNECEMFSKRHCLHVYTECSHLPLFAPVLAVRKAWTPLAGRASIFHECADSKTKNTSSRTAASVYSLFFTPWGACFNTLMTLQMSSVGMELLIS